MAKNPTRVISMKRRDGRDEAVGADVSPLVARLLQRLERKVDDDLDVPSGPARPTQQKLVDADSNAEIYVVPHPVSLADLANLLYFDATHFACVALKAAAVSGGGWAFESPGGGESGAVTDKQVEAAKAFFEAPHPEHSFDEILNRAEIDFQATGNAFLEVVRRRDGKPQEINHIISHTVYVVDKETSVQQLRVAEEDLPDYVQFLPSPNSHDGTRGQLAFFNVAGAEGRALEYQGHDVSELIHLREYSPLTEDYGLPSILAVLKHIAILRSAQQFRASVFEDAGIPPTMLIYEGADEIPAEDRARLENYFNKEVQQGISKLIVLATEANVQLKLQQLSIMQNLSAELLRELLIPLRDEIMRIHRVPPRLIAVPDTRGLGGSAEALAQMEQFQAMVIDARQRMWERRFNRAVVAGFGTDWKLKLKPLSIRSLMELQKYYLGYLDRGVINRDTVRKLALNLDPIPDGQGEQYLIMMGGQPFDMGKPGPKPGETVTGIESENSQQIN